MTMPNSENFNDRLENTDSESRDLPENPPPEEILETMLEQTKHFLDKDSFHERFTQYVRQHRLTSKFDFENLSELVRCVLEQTRIQQLPIEYEAVSYTHLTLPTTPYV